MIQDEFAESFAHTQAIALNNRHLLQFLFEELLANDPEADAKLARLSDRMTRFYEKPGTRPEVEANLIEVNDSFIAHLRAGLRKRDR